MNTIKFFSFSCIALVFSFFTTLKAQNNQFLAETEGYRNVISKHLLDIKLKMNDSSYKQALIPKESPIKTNNYKTNTINTHFPYPVIMVHGLASNSDTWLGLYNYVTTQGWTFGGRLDFCLNSDSDNGVANLTTDITDYTSNLTDADFYTVNFDVNPDGTAFNNTVLSNQAAIYKQGVAIKTIINHVLTVTGKDKVIMLVHSMGGLATRQYLQNSSLWQADGRHHIAKFATLGTPHGGSNLDGTFLLNWLFPPDVQSDAVRDLRRSYYWSGEPGTFLHGGLEDYDYMWNALFYDYYNTDVNCNGIYGESILGINQKSISTNLDFTCLYGETAAALTAGDGVVSVHDAQLKNFYPTLSAETFSCTDGHTNLPGLIKEDYLCIDEPDEFALGYFINKDTLYNGFITTQATDCAYITDYDQYNFNVQQTGNINVQLGNLRVTPFRIKLLDGAYNTVLTQTFTTLSGTTTAVPVTAGKYYMQLSSLPNDTSWKYPYNYKIVFSQAVTTDITQLVNTHNVSIFPNPTDAVLNLTATNEASEMVEVLVTNMIGEVIYKIILNDTYINHFIDLSNNANGLYFISVTSPTTNYSTKFSKIN